jgi:hypothetical protein
MKVSGQCHSPEYLWREGCVGLRVSLGALEKSPFLLREFQPVFVCRSDRGLVAIQAKF